MSILKSTDELKTASQICDVVSDAISKIRGVDFETFDFGDFLPIKQVMLQRKRIVELGYISTKDGKDMMDYYNELICKYLGIY